MSDNLEQSIAEYLAERLEGAEAVEVSGLQRIHGGASRETFRVRAAYRAGSETIERGLIIRRDPTNSLIETDRANEFHAYAAFHGSGVPVPEPLFLEENTDWLDRPFFVMEQIEDCQAASPFAPNPYGMHREAIGKQFFHILGLIAGADPTRVGLASKLETPAPDAAWLRELDYWEGVIDEDEREPQPIARATIRHLRRSPPPPATALSVVHGDYRTGNFLFDEAGTIRAVLDWEMVHLGDPHEDLAWALDRLWALGSEPSMAAGMLPREQAITIWEDASGLKVDEAALDWWTTFASLKGLAIWISSAREYSDGRNMDPVLAFSGWFCTTVHNEVLAERVGNKESPRP